MSVLGVAIVALGLVLCAALVAGGQVVAARGRATLAADAAALAAAPVTFRAFGASGGPAAEAARLASDNGAELVACRCPVDRSYADRIVEVEVQVHTQVLGTWSVRIGATSAAEFRPTELLLSGE